MQLKDKIISVEVIPSAKESKFGEEFLKKETYGFTHEFDQWFVDYVENMYKRLPSKGSKRYSINSDGNSEDYLIAPDANIKLITDNFKYFRKYKNFATRPVFKANSYYGTSVDSNMVYSMAEFEKLVENDPEDNEVLYDVEILVVISEETFLPKYFVKIRRAFI